MILHVLVAVRFLSVVIFKVDPCEFGRSWVALPPSLASPTVLITVAENYIFPVHHREFFSICLATCLFCLRCVYYTAPATVQVALLPSMSPHQRFCPDCGTTIGERPPRLIRCADCRLARYRTLHSGSLRQHPVSPVDFDPFRNSIIPTSTIPQGQSSIIDLPSSGKRPANQLLCPRAKRPALFQHDNAQGILHQAIEFLRLEHGERVAASNAFPPEIPPSRIRESLASYEEEIAAASKTSACCSCGRLVCVADIYQVGNRDSLLRPLEGSLDHCGRHGDKWDLCSSCHAALMRGTIPKFSATNLVNVTLCQHYPDELEDLTLSEEYLIAKCHPLGVVVKLRPGPPGGRSYPVNYHALRGQFIVISRALQSELAINFRVPAFVSGQQRAAARVIKLRWGPTEG